MQSSSDKYVIFLVHCSPQNDITLRCSQPWFVGVLGLPVVSARPPRQIINGIYHPKGPLFLLHEVSRTEALLCARSKACNRRPVWTSAYSNNQLKEEYFLYLLSYQSKTEFDARTLFGPVASKFFTLKKSAHIEKSVVVNIQTYAYGPSRALGKKH